MRLNGGAWNGSVLSANSGLDPAAAGTGADAVVVDVAGAQAATIAATGSRPRRTTRRILREFITLLVGERSCDRCLNLLPSILVREPSPPSATTWAPPL